MSGNPLARAICVLFAVVACIPLGVQAQHSVARKWNEALLDAIRVDFARPTVHSRNLFHTSTAMYDAWAAFDDVAEPFLLGKTVRGYACSFTAFPAPADVKAAREESISYAAYRLLTYRFQASPGAAASLARFDSLMAAFGYDTSFTSTDYSGGSAAALGNHIATCLIEFGLQDGSHEADGYAYQHYLPVNPPLVPTFAGNPRIVDPNRWQPLEFETFVDQSGNVIPGSVPKFLGPEWGEVTPFALTDADLTVYERSDGSYWVYHDPGSPPLIDPQSGSGLSAEYEWGFALVAAWSSHLDPDDGVMWDISPRSFGNNQSYPTRFEDYRDFYDLENGGDHSPGRPINPFTGAEYEPQIVPRGDYTRVLAEFWADGPRSETPPGHWFTILNYVSDHPAFVKRYRGQGAVIDDLEWDVKAYFTLGGAVHDAAVTAWGIKGWYDYVRPISAIRSMTDRGQCSDPNLPNYSPGGIPLVDGVIEMVTEEDPLAGGDGENVGKIKLRAWRAHAYIADPATETAGVDWILADNWWPYQLQTFVTPPFAGYISGHSTFSRAAAEVLTFLTGDPFFPGGMGEFHAKKNEFLSFEDGPSVDVTLQWATYRDASDQTSLSRIWGGIHPPADDMPGRHIGIEIGTAASLLADSYFAGEVTGIDREPIDLRDPALSVYPNPVVGDRELTVEIDRPARSLDVRLYNILGQEVWQSEVRNTEAFRRIAIPTSGITSGAYLVVVRMDDRLSSHKVIVAR